MQVRSTFWPAKYPIIRADRATIPHLKEGYQSYLLIKFFEFFQTNSYILSIFLS